MKSTDFLRIGIFYDGTYFTKAQNYFWGQRKEWLTFKEFHNSLRDHSNYKAFSYLIEAISLKGETLLPTKPEIASLYASIRLIFVISHTCSLKSKI